MSALAEGHCIGPYRIVRLLGEGGMGAVYEARHEPLGRRVALKTLHPEYAHNQDVVARFFNEAKILSRLEHPSIVQVSDFGNAPDGTAYLVMEHLRGQSLARRLSSRDGRLPVVEALQLAWQVADVLAIAHAQQIVHRDLKPDNLMLVSDPVAPGGERVKVLDFGIAKLTKESDRGGVKTHTHALMGTPMYMSPEQCAGAGGVDAKSDVYSLGCVLYQMIGGRPPFEGEGAGQLIGKHLYQEPASLASLASKVPPSVIELVHRMLIKDKQRRPSMSETADTLGRLLSKLPGAGPVTRSRSPAEADPDATQHISVLRQLTTKAHSIWQQRDSISRRGQLLVAGGAAVLIVVVAVVWQGQISRHPRLDAPATTTAGGLQSTTPKTLNLSPPDAATPPDAKVTTTAVAPLSVTAEQPKPSPPEQAVPALAPMVRWEVNTSPPGAIVLDGRGNVLGKTPWTEEHTARDGVRKLRLRSFGYSEESLELDEAADATKTLTLKHLPPPKPLPVRPNFSKTDESKEQNLQLVAAKRALMEGSHDQAIKLSEPYCTAYNQHKLSACRIVIVSLCARKNPGDEVKVQNLFRLLDPQTKATVRQQCVAAGVDPIKAKLD